MLSRVQVYVSEFTAETPAFKMRIPDDRTATLLDHQFFYIISIPPVFAVLFIVLIGVDKEYSQNPICNSPVKLHEWVYYGMAMVVGSSLLTCTLQIVRIATLMRSKLKTRNAPLIRINIVLFVLSVISGTSKTLTMASSYGGICHDNFGVYSPAAQWAEWLVLVPFLSYIACAVEQKTHLGRFDRIMLFFLFTLILCGFLMIVDVPFGVSVVFFLGSLISISIVSYMTITNYRRVMAAPPQRVRSMLYFSSKQSRRKATLLMYLLVFLWYYPLIWFCGASGVLTADYTYMAYIMGSLFGKSIFCTLVTESHVALLYEYLIATSSNSDMIDINASIGEHRTPMPTSPRSPVVPFDQIPEGAEAGEV